MSTSGTESQKYVVYSFSGSKESFQEWKTKTLSLSRVHKVHKYLTTQVQGIPTEDEAETLSETSANYKKYEKNIRAYDLLIRSCTGTPLGLVEKVEDANAYEAWKALIKEYETSEDDVHELEEKWKGCVLGDFGTNPTDWFLQLDRLNRLLKSIDEKYEKDSVQYSGHILKNMCKEYSTVVTSLNTSGKAKDVDAIKEAVKLHWKEHHGNNGEVKEAFYIGRESNGNQKFKGKCNYCQKSGHKWKDCFKRKNDIKNGKLKEESSSNTDSGEKGSRKCWLCGGNHFKKECPKYKKGGNNGEVNALNHVFGEGLFVCEYVDMKRTYKEALMLGEVNMSISTSINDRKKLIGEEEQVQSEQVNAKQFFY